jgi:hypothetical protein
MQRLENPLPLWLDQRGDLVDAGYIYVGTARQDPQVSPIDVYWDEDLTQLAVQPLRTRGGVIVNGGSPAMVYLGNTDYSLTVRDSDGALVNYIPSASATGGVDFQPLDADLTAIAALATTTYGRSLLTAANAAGLRSLAGVVSSLPLTGGTVSGNILRSGAGPHLYHTNGAFGSGRVYVTANTASDPTSAAGDIWIKYAP